MSAKISAYNDALDFILAREHFGIKLGLENISNFLEAIGRPQDKFPSVHIAGTNGKGSTASYIDAIVREAGYRSGVFTSPHLVDFRERIKVNGERISTRFITEFVKKHRAVMEEHKITFFEVCTALAFSYFAHKKVDLGVIEVGLGGRLDATNTIVPLVSVITDISYDHTNLLGETLDKIAWEKAGIIKPGVPVHIGILPPPARKAVLQVCRERCSPLDSLKKQDFTMNGKPFGFYFHDNDSAWENLNLRSSLPGRHQIKNAALAVQVCRYIAAGGFKIGRMAIKRGLKNTHWPARFEIFHPKNRPTIILDVGHNPAGVKATVETFRDMYPGRKAHLVMGFVRFKNLKEIVTTLEKIALSVQVCQLKTYRSTPPEEIASHFSGKVPVEISQSLVESARKVINNARPDDIVVICGSHFAVGEFMAEMNDIL